MKPEPGAIRYYWTYRILALLWMATIFFLSSRHDLPIPSLFWGQDKVEHALAFGLLGFLFASSFRGGQHGSYGKRLAVVMLLVVAYGFLDEAHQYFVPGRDASFWDLCADATGGFLTAFLFLRYKASSASH